MTYYHSRKSRLENAFERCSVYGITGGSTDVVPLVESMLEGGIRIVQYREKGKTPSIRYHEALMLRHITERYGALLIINDYIDLALAVKADGVHIGQDDLPPRIVRTIVGESMLIGWSTHNIENLESANRYSDCIDYIGVGPVYATPTKPNAIPVGLSYVAWAAKHSVLPTVAIGGITVDNVRQVWDQQPTMVCAVRAIVESPHMDITIEDLCNEN
ncbi:thiamine phosphate synthase [Veillonella agrestimuris]|uniref:thiamine phosphate synthase n=1 Tax=Veillonella agrestimuris TaxID=2941340 RepID=UPI00203EC987|nr:thiamine phosphate synthase [Veillonella agrestimuris]